MTATEELRRLLDGRGATIDESIYPDRRFAIRVVGSDAEILLDNSYGKTCRFAVFNLTPAQAVEATLGRGTCRMVPTRDKPRSKVPTLTCSECGWWTDEIGKAWNYCPSCGRRVIG